MGPSQICGCLFCEPRVFTIAHMCIYLSIYYMYLTVCYSATSTIIPKMPLPRRDAATDGEVLWHLGRAATQGSQPLGGLV